MIVSITLLNILHTQHYDYPPILYERMLDKNMQYSCAFWGDCSNNSERIDSTTLSAPTSKTPSEMSLEVAQQRKLQLIVAKLQIEDGMNVLDIGCGWGGLAAFIASKLVLSLYIPCN